MYFVQFLFFALWKSHIVRPLEGQPGYAYNPESNSVTQETLSEGFHLPD